MIAEYELSTGKFNSLVIDDRGKSVTVWGPGKVCTKCSGFGFGLAPTFKERITDPGGNRPLKKELIPTGYKRIVCSKCKGRPIGGIHKLKLNKEKHNVRLRACPPARYDYTYIGAPMQ